MNVTDIPSGWAAIIAALIAVVGGPIAGVVLHRMTKALREIRKDAAVTRDHVANEHVDERGDPINMRDDQDQKHEETMDGIGGLTRDLRALVGEVRDLKKDMGGVRHELRALRDSDAEQTRQANRDRERLDRVIEDTIPRDELGRFIKKEEL